MKINTSSLCGLFYLAVIVFSPNVSAAEFNCEPGPHNCLYDTVVAANQTNEADVIRFSEGFHYSTTPFGTRCAPPILGDITIIGASSVNTYLVAQGSCAFFHVNPGSTLTLRNIVIADANLTGSIADQVQRGAAVYNEGVLHIERSILRGNGINDNFVNLSGGGAIYNAPRAKAFVSDTEFFYNSVERENYGGAAILNEGIMRVIRSRFFENNGFGGIIANGIAGSPSDASLIINDSIIEKNLGSTGIRNHAKLLVERTTVRDGDGFEGGGIYNGGNLTLRASTLFRNKAVRGGGIYSAKGAKSTFINSTITQNHARGRVEGNGIGGGVFNYGGTVYVANSTIAENTSEGLGSAIAATSDADGTARVYIKGSLIVGHSNTRQDQSCYDFGPNDAQKLFLVENNLITEESNCFPSATDIVVDEATAFTEIIAPLSGYGGRTPTYALRPGSPAIDNAGKQCTEFTGAPIAIDQRGRVRTGCDIGSVDAPAAIPPVELQLILLPGQFGIEPNSTGTLILAILSRVDSTNPFEPLVDLERSSLRLGSAGAVPFRYTRQDRNGDGIDDLVMRFNISETGIACGEKAIELRGTIIGANNFVATTAITTIGCTVN